MSFGGASCRTLLEGVGMVGRLGSDHDMTANEDTLKQRIEALSMSSPNLALQLYMLAYSIQPQPPNQPTLIRPPVLASWPCMPSLSELGTRRLHRLRLFQVGGVE